MKEREIRRKEKKIEKKRKEKIDQFCTCCAWEDYLAFPVCDGRMVVDGGGGGGWWWWWMVEKKVL